MLSKQILERQVLFSLICKHLKMCVGHEIRREILRRKESEGNGGKDRVIGSIGHECKGRKLSKGREPVIRGKKRIS